MTSRRDTREALERVERLRRSGRIEEALSRLATLAAEAPSDGRVAFEWGMTLAHWASRPEEARRQFDRALELAPGLQSARFQRALVALRLGDAEASLEDLELLRAGNFRQRGLLHLHRARALEALGRPAEAERAWTAGIDAGPPSAWLLEQRARLRQHLGRFAEAEADLTAALEAAAAADEFLPPALLLARAVVRRMAGDGEGARLDAEAARDATLPEEEALRQRAKELLSGLLLE